MKQVIFTLILSSILASQAYASSTEHYKSIDPMYVHIYKYQPKHQAYRVIDHVKIARFNPEGGKRQEGIMTDILKDDAALEGGNGIVNLTSNQQGVSGDVIRFNQTSQSVALKNLPHYVI